jgi:pseudaminic acid synthase
LARNITIAGRRIGHDYPPYVLAELSGNHNGDIERAFKLMEAAKVTGADGIKIQTYTADTLTIDHDGPEFRIEGGLWGGHTLYSLYQEAHTPWDWHDALFAKARELDITLFSTPFDATAVDFLEQLGAPAYKIASFEVVDLALIAKAAATGKPLIISTGMADLSEIGEAVATAREYGSGEIVLLHCVSAYPAPPEESNLKTIPHLAAAFDVAVGLSDHTPGGAVPSAAVALGAVLVEKHMTLRRADGGPDAAFSLEPEEFRLMTESCRIAAAALGEVNYRRTASEGGSMVYRRSLYVVHDVKAGDAFSAENVRSIRPGFGLKPKHLSSVIGRRASRDITRGTALDWAMIGEVG